MKDVYGCKYWVFPIKQVLDLDLYTTITTCCMQNHNLPLYAMGDYIFGNTAALSTDEIQKTICFIQAFTVSLRLM